MKKSKLWLLCIFVLAFVIACGPAPDTATSTPDRTDQEQEVEGDVFPRPTITPAPENEEAGSQSEEAESAPVPTETPAPDEYPAPVNQIVQPESAYPADGTSVWVVLPVGVQCEENSGEYASLDEAVKALEAAGVVVTEQGTISLAVVTACGGPTSEHYHVQILAAGQQQAESLGWQLSDE